MAKEAYRQNLKKYVVHLIRTRQEGSKEGYNISCFFLLRNKINFL